MNSQDSSTTAVVEEICTCCRPCNKFYEDWCHRSHGKIFTQEEYFKALMDHVLFVKKSVAALRLYNEHHGDSSSQTTNAVCSVHGSQQENSDAVPSCWLCKNQTSIPSTTSDVVDQEKALPKGSHYDFQKTSENLRNMKMQVNDFYSYLADKEDKLDQNSAHLTTSKDKMMNEMQDHIGHLHTFIDQQHKSVLEAVNQQWNAYHEKIRQFKSQIQAAYSHLPCLLKRIDEASYMLDSMDTKVFGRVPELEDEMNAVMNINSQDLEKAYFTADLPDMTQNNDLSYFVGSIRLINESESLQGSVPSAINVAETTLSQPDPSLVCYQESYSDYSFTSSNEYGQIKDDHLVISHSSTVGQDSSSASHSDCLKPDNKILNGPISRDDKDYTEMQTQSVPQSSVFPQDICNNTVAIVPKIPQKPGTALIFPNISAFKEDGSKFTYASMVKKNPNLPVSTNYSLPGSLVASSFAGSQGAVVSYSRIGTLKSFLDSASNRMRLNDRSPFPVGIESCKKMSENEGRKKMITSLVPMANNQVCVVYGQNDPHLDLVDENGIILKFKKMTGQVHHATLFDLDKILILKSTPPAYSICLLDKNFEESLIRKLDFQPSCLGIGSDEVVVGSKKTLRWYSFDGVLNERVVDPNKSPLKWPCACVVWQHNEKKIVCVADSAAEAVFFYERKKIGFKSLSPFKTSDFHPRSNDPYFSDSKKVQQFKPVSLSIHPGGPCLAILDGITSSIAILNKDMQLVFMLEKQRLNLGDAKPVVIAFSLNCHDKYTLWVATKKPSLLLYALEYRFS